MKSVQNNTYPLQTAVAPFAGAWIEISVAKSKYLCVAVAPFAGAWIEIICHYASPPLNAVAPFAGAWIEIIYCFIGLYGDFSRSLRGSVD